MKTLLSLENGAITITEQGGDFFLNFSGSVGGGVLAGILSGSGSVKLGSGSVALKAAEGFVNHLLPAAAQDMAKMIEDALNAEVTKM